MCVTMSSLGFFCKQIPLGILCFVALCILLVYIRCAPFYWLAVFVFVDLCILFVYVQDVSPLIVILYQQALSLLIKEKSYMFALGQKLKSCFGFALGIPVGPSLQGHPAIICACDRLGEMHLRPFGRRALRSCGWFVCPKIRTQTDGPQIETARLMPN